MLIRRISDYDSLETKINELEATNQGLPREQVENTKTKKTQEAKIADNYLMIKAAEEFENVGGHLELLEAIIKKVRILLQRQQQVPTTSANNSEIIINYDDAIDKFANDVLAQYDPLGDLRLLYLQRKKRFLI
jgi:hypothetical protein